MDCSGPQWTAKAYSRLQWTAVLSNRKKKKKNFFSAFLTEENNEICNLELPVCGLRFEKATTLT